MTPDTDSANRIFMEGARKNVLLFILLIIWFVTPIIIFCYLNCYCSAKTIVCFLYKLIKTFIDWSLSIKYAIINMSKQTIKYRAYNQKNLLNRGRKNLAPRVWRRIEFGAFSITYSS